MPTLTVTVNAAGTNGTVHPPQQHIPHGNSSTLLEWRITSPNYVFPAAGALIWNQTSVPFDPTYVLTGNSTILTVNDQNNTPGTYTYSIIVNPTNSPTAIRIGRGDGPGALMIDPEIINDLPSE
jgi:hypothetical protein